MARKLRIYTGERHDFEGHPQLQAFTMPPRKLRIKGELFELPPGFEPFNPQAYYVSAGWRGKVAVVQVGPVEACREGPRLPCYLRFRQRCLSACMPTLPTALPLLAGQVRPPPGQHGGAAAGAAARRRGGSSSGAGAVGAPRAWAQEQRLNSPCLCALV